LSDSANEESVGQEDRTLPVPCLPAIRNGALSQYIEKYLVEDIHGYRCEGCNDAEKPKERKQVLAYGPEFLSFQLKRTNNWGRKVPTSVAIDQFLDLNAFRDADNKENLAYALAAVIKHQGNDGEQGHYICFAKGPDGRWMEFNDEVMEASTFDKAISSKGRFVPYLVFYQRQ
jgi:uncharacterized UBP type Zn finger protein